ncbi:unnamed protein product [Rhizophagus irregularis]|nr:unnamed protein product [Rhizophagus irregularis]
MVGLFYRITPNQTLTSRPVSGIKKDKTRITVLLGCSSNGTEKIKLLVIGNAQKPHCLCRININNASSHLEPKKKEANNNELYNSDETSAAESLHAAKNKKGKKWAVKYKQYYCRHLIRQFDNGKDMGRKLNLLEAINYLSDAWLDVSQNTISNCWAKAGILPSVNHVQREVASDQIDMELDVEFEEIEELLEILPDIGTPFLDDIDHYIKELEELPVEEFLDDKQIIEYATKDSSEEVISDSEPELEIISIKEAAQGLKTFITFFTQQSDHSGFCSKDLKIFNKYSKLMNVKLFESKKQTSIDSFFN